MKAYVDQDLCIGCGLCPQICPEVFQMDDDKAVVIVDEVPVAVTSTCSEAGSQCPVEAITVEP